MNGDSLFTDDAKKALLIHNGRKSRPLLEISPTSLTVDY